jgi:hypothetical protein
MTTAREVELGLDGASQKRAKALDRAKLCCEILDRACQGVTYGGVEVTSVKFNLAGYPTAESLAIVTGVDHDGTPIVAFHRAVSFGELFTGLVSRLANGTLKWKEDEFKTRKATQHD